MERCRSYQELLSLSLDQPLTPADQNALDRHLSQCSQCRALSRQLGQIHNELALWPEEDVPAGFADGVMDRIRADAAPKVVPLWKRPQIKAL
jgi:predicted anti-sigma-YlaC factor YlaD